MPVLDKLRSTLTAPESGVRRPTTPLRPPPHEGDSFSNEWSVARRVGFRFVFAYLILYNFPFPLGALPLTEVVNEWYVKPWHVVVPWIAAHLLHLAKPITVFSNGSGDTTYDYVLLFVCVTIAGFVALGWSLADRRARAYRRLELGLRIYVRYVLAFALLAYGAFKVIKTQFPYPGLERLVEPFGEFSPMGVVWTWMGLSYAYNLYAGLAEMSSGFLLFFRRTTMLGSLLAIAVMSNIVMLNFAYDVPVKLYSVHLLLMALYLVAPDVKRFVDAFILNRGMARAELDRPRWHSRRVRIGALGVKTLLVLTGVGSPLWLSLKYSRQLEQHPPLYGIWDIDTFVRGRDTMPALLGDVVRWRRLVVSHPGFLSLHLLNDSTRGFGVNVDTLKGTLQWTSVRDSAVTGSFRYLRSGVFHDQLALDGVLNKDSLHVRLHRVDESRFLLVNRGYHWINEFPFNR